MLNKKASFENLRNLILTLLVLGVLYFVFTNVYTNFLISSGSKEACKNWVNMQSTPVLKEIGTFESSCVTSEETIKNVKDQSEIYKILANNMYDCWDMYGRGEANFYGDVDWGSSDTYCRICSEIKIDSDLDVNKRNFEVDEFEKYLSNEHPPGHKESYSEFFLKAENAKIDFGSGTINLDPDKKFYSIFVVNKGSDWSTWGIINKFVIVPGTIFLGGSQIPGAKKIPQGIGGLVKYTKYTSITTPVVSAGGAGLGTTTAKIGTVAKGGGVWGMAILYVGIATAATLADGTILHPTLLLLQSDTPKLSECDGGIYYKPISQINKK